MWRCLWQSTARGLRKRGTRRLSTGSPFDPRTTTYLRSQRSGTEVYLVGTSHISEKSANQVRQIVQTVRPQVVLVELCAGRMEQLLRRENMSATDATPLEDVFQGIFGQALPPAMRSGQRYEQYRRASDAFGEAFGLNQKTAMEFIAAIEEGKKLGAEIVPFDRSKNDIFADLRTISMPEVFAAAGRLMSNPGSAPPELARIAKDFDPATLSFGPDIMERVKDRQFVDAMARWIDDVFPTLTRIIIHERDQHMYDGLLRLKPCTTAVAVVGVGHVSGIERRWLETES